MFYTVHMGRISIAPAVGVVPVMAAIGRSLHAIPTCMKWLNSTYTQKNTKHTIPFT